MAGFSVKSERCASDCRGLCEARGKLDERVVMAGLSFNSHVMGAHYWGGRLSVMG